MTRADLTVETELHADTARTVFQADDLVIVPDDGIVISCIRVAS